MSELTILNTLLFVGEMFAASVLIAALAFLAATGPAARRHLVWCAAFAALLVLPVLAAMVPGRIVYTLPAPPPVADTLPDLPAAAALPAAPVRDSIHIDAVLIVQVLLGLWAAGAIALLLRGLIAAVVLHFYLRDSSEAPFEPVEIPELAHPRPYRLRVSNGERGPITWGFFRPVILLPRQSLFWPCERLQAVMRHELAHVSRRDTLTQTLSLLACALYWPNPLVWLGLRAQRRAAEMAADDAVIVSGMMPSEYACELLKVATACRGEAPAHALLMAAPSALSARVQAILSPAQRRTGVNAMDVSKIACIALAASAALVVARPSFAEEVPPTAAAATPALPATPPVPPAPEAADMPAPPTPPEALPAPPAPPAPPILVHVDRGVRIVHVMDTRDAKGHRHRRVRIDVTADAPDIAVIAPEMERTLAEVKAHEFEIRRIEAMRPVIDAKIREALARARVELGRIDDAKIRARVDAALARVQRRYEEHAMPDAPADDAGRNGDHSADGGGE